MQKMEANLESYKVESAARNAAINDLTRGLDVVLTGAKATDDAIEQLRAAGAAAAADAHAHISTAVESVQAAAKERDAALADVSKSIAELRTAADERELVIAAVAQDMATLRVETSAEMTKMREGIVALVAEAETHSASVQEVMTGLADVQVAMEKGSALSPEATAALDAKLVGLGKRMGGVEDSVKSYSDRLGKDMEAWQSTLDDDVKGAIEAVRAQTVANSDALSAAAKEIEKLRAAKAAAPPPSESAGADAGGGLARSDTIKLVQETIRPDLDALTKRTKSMEAAIKSFTEKLESDVEMWQVSTHAARARAEHASPHHLSNAHNRSKPPISSRPWAPR